MVYVQIDIDDDLVQVVELVKAKQRFKNREEAMKYIINEYNTKLLK